MFVQITTRCNMRCAHCIFACGPTGEDMRSATFRAAIRHPEEVTIGGGEPTVHPHFWLFFFEALEAGRRVRVVTNGKRTADALRLARLARLDEERNGRYQRGLSDRRKVIARLSQDEYHDPVDPSVVSAFAQVQKGVLSIGQEELRNGGRCDFAVNEGCPCPTVHVFPNGVGTQCGCLDSPAIGDVSQLIPRLRRPALDPRRDRLIYEVYVGGRYVLRAKRYDELGTDTHTDVCSSAEAGFTSVQVDPGGCDKILWLKRTDSGVSLMEYDMQRDRAKRSSISSCITVGDTVCATALLAGRGQK